MCNSAPPEAGARLSQRGKNSSVLTPPLEFLPLQLLQRPRIEVHPTPSRPSRPPRDGSPPGLPSPHPWGPERARMLRKGSLAGATFLWIGAVQNRCLFFVVVLGPDRSATVPLKTGTVRMLPKGFWVGAIFSVGRCCSKPVCVFWWWPWGPIDQQQFPSKPIGSECFRKGPWSDPSASERVLGQNLFGSIRDHSVSKRYCCTSIGLRGRHPQTEIGSEQNL